MNKFFNSLPLMIAIALLIYSCIDKGSVNINRREGDLEVIPETIYDGDTVKVKEGNEIKTIRFACVDAPELEQLYGIESRDYLRSIIAENNYRINLEEVTKDRYGRMVGVLYLENCKSVQELQVLNGWVYPYERYKDDCPIWTTITQNEAIAVNNRVNLYGKNLTKPWEWRRQNK